MDTYIRGDSIKLEIPLVDEDSVAIDLSGLATIAISVYHGKLLTVLKAGTYAGEEITYDDAESGIMYFHIEDSLTTSASRGIYKYKVTVTETDAGFADSTDTSITDGNAFRLR